MHLLWNRQTVRRSAEEAADSSVNELVQTVTTEEGSLMETFNDDHINMSGLVDKNCDGVWEDNDIG